MQLVLVSLWYLHQRVQLTKQLYPIVRLYVVETVAEHLQQCVQYTPRTGLKYTRQQLT